MRRIPFWEGAVRIVGAAGKGLRAACAGAWLCAGASAIAQSDGLELRVEMDAARMITMVDVDSGRVLMSPNLQAVWGPGMGSVMTPLEPEVRFRPMPDGYDVVYTFRNTSNDWRSPGTLYVPGIRFGRVIGSRDFYTDGKRVTIDHADGNYFGGGNIYPRTMYSPVAIVTDGDYTIGVSLKYPILDYAHAAFIRIESPGGQYTEGGRNWQVKLDLNPSYLIGGDRVYNAAGDLPPRSTRTYEVSCRVIRNTTEGHRSAWMRTLEPYRAFFQCRYGAARYTRDPRPVVGAILAYSEFLSESNPMGFYDESLRPDAHGWGPWVARLDAIRAGGFSRFCLWNPTGLYFVNRHFNYPFQFTSHWQDDWTIRTTLPLLAQFAQAGIQLGLWWGHASSVSFGWDADFLTDLDPAVPEHRAAALNEMAGAAGVNATLVGLDSFTSMPVWDAYPWLEQLKAAFPRVTFVTEYTSCDVLHTLAPTYIFGTRAPDESRWRVTNEHYLADFLIPGHETWAQVNEEHVKQELGYPSSQSLTDEELQAAMLRFSGWGYVAHPFTQHRLAAPYSRFNALDSRSSSVPPEFLGPYYPLVLAPPPDVAFQSGQTVRLAASLWAGAGGAVSYRWSRNGQPLADGDRITGSAGPELVITGLVRADAATYSLEIANSCGAGTSTACVLTPACAADINDDGRADDFDFFEYLNQFSASDSRADVNGDGAVDDFDFFDFLSSFFRGCP
ncbi:MAG: hypothetical protein JNM07_07705 [Phycisphaerae bacterium]|nr:hypothetical protein [Phycisphaerae bacterium]